jgi:hypothetical protein
LTFFENFDIINIENVKDASSKEKNGAFAS